MLLKDRVVVVTGGAGLIGKEFVYEHKDLFITDAVQLLKESAPEAVDSETL